MQNFSTDSTKKCHKITEIVGFFWQFWDEWIDVADENERRNGVRVWKERSLSFRAVKWGSRATEEKKKEKTRQKADERRRYRKRQRKGGRTHRCKQLDLKWIRMKYKNRTREEQTNVYYHCWSQPHNETTLYNDNNKN